MTGIWIGGAVLAAAAFGWRMAVLICCLAAALLLMRRRSHESVIALLICGAATLGAVRGAPPPVASPPLWIDAATGLRGHIDTPPTSSGRVQRFRVAVTEVEHDNHWLPTGGSICVTSAPFPVTGLGDRVTLGGAPESLADQSAATRAFLRNRGCEASLFAPFLAIDEPGSGWQRGFADLRSALSGVLRRAAPGDSGALLSGLATGDDHTLTADRQAAFLRTGTTHITAVSGANMALVVSVFATLGIVGGIRHHLGWQLAVVLAVWAYAVMVGGDPPVVRAALVASGAIVAVRFGRRPDFVTLIALAAALMILIEPAQIWSLSFQLSFAASLGIVLVMSGLTIDGPLVGLRAALQATLAAQIATLPVLWFVIGQLSLTTLPANLMIAPLISVAFPLAALAAAMGLIWEPLAIVLVLPARLCADLVFLIVDTLGGSPRAMAAVGESSPFIAMLVSALAVTAILVMSSDARLWFDRVMTRMVDRIEPKQAPADHNTERPDSG